MMGNRLHLRAFSGLCVFLTMAMFATMSLLTVVLGAQVYQSVVHRSEHTHAVRTTLAYVTGKLRSGGGQQIRVETAPAGYDVLIFAETVDGDAYETRIYAYDGQLYEVFTAADAEFAPEEGQTIAPVDGFAVAQEPGGLLRLTATIGAETYTSCVALAE